jgi:3-deoxy-D-manno-octulosonic-acid transferase
VADSEELVEVVDELLSDPDEAARLGRAGQEVLEQNRGALERLLVLLEPLLGSDSPG